MVVFLPAILLFFTASAADARSASTDGTGSPSASDVKKEDRRICRTARSTGSRLRRTRVCMTTREWENQERALQQDLNRRPALDRSQI